MKIKILAASCVAIIMAACVRPPLQPAISRPDPDAAAREAARADSIARANARADSIALANAARARAEQDSLRAEREREELAASQTVDASSLIRATVYFDYDQSTLGDAARSALDAKVPLLKAQPAVRIRITGNTDSRGAAEYNLALGLRRAAETKAYLVANGIAESRIEIMSMGAERPAVEGDNEAAWSKNRRAEFAPISGE